MLSNWPLFTLAHSTAFISALQHLNGTLSHGVKFIWHNFLQILIENNQSIFKKKCYLLAYLLALFGGLGITAGAHRLWSHRSYKAKWPLRLLLAIAQTVAGQVCYRTVRIKITIPRLLFLL